jgi:hypothetical protein
MRNELCLLGFFDERHANGDPKALKDELARFGSLRLALEHAKQARIWVWLGGGNRSLQLVLQRLQQNLSQVLQRLLGGATATN